MKGSTQNVALPALGQGVRVIAGGDAKNPLQVTMVVDWVTEDAGIGLRLPKDHDGEVYPAGASVTVEYFREGTLYRVDARVKGVSSRFDQRAQINVLELEPPKKGSGVQPRRFTRYEIALPVRFVRIELPDGFKAESWRGRRAWSRFETELQERGSNTRCSSVSASGLRFDTEALVAVGDILLLEVSFRQNPVMLLARVVWVERGGIPRGVGLEFVGVDDAKRSEIAYFVETEAQRLQDLMR